MDRHYNLENPVELVYVQLFIVSPIPDTLCVQYGCTDPPVGAGAGLAVVVTWWNGFVSVAKALS